MGSRESGTEQERSYAKGRGIGNSLFGEENLHMRQIQRTKKGLGFAVINSSLFKRIIIAESEFTISFTTVSFNFLRLDLR